MPVQKTAEQFIELMQRFISLRPKMILPEHVIQFKKKMEGLKSKMDGSGGNPEDHAFLFRILILLARSEKPVTMSETIQAINLEELEARACELLPQMF